MRFINESLTFAVSTLGASTNSNPTYVGNVYNASFQAVVTDSGGGVVGTVKLQFSNDVAKAGELNSTRYSAVTNWTDITDSSQAVAAAGSFGWNLQNIGYEWIRVVYTRTSGNGTIAVRISGKGA